MLQTEHRGFLRLPHGTHCKICNVGQKKIS
nr:MAG TPA: vWA domain-containing protein [Bacteriophage sp.]